MAIRLIELYHRKGKPDDMAFLLQDVPILDMWHDHLPEGDVITKILIQSEHIDRVVDILNNFYGGGEEIRMVILPVEATLPRPGVEDKEEEEKEKQAGPKKRLSVEELYQKIEGGSGHTRRYILMTVLASIVAAIGLMKDDVAVIIGSMVIAPLLGPYMGLSLSATLADGRLARKALPTIVSGTAIAVAVGLVFGLLLDVDPMGRQIASRSDVSYFYIILALASGVAGAYSITKGVAEAVVGVMVAVALLPPLVATGLLLGDGYPVAALGSFILFSVNAVCINLSGVLTFALEGVKPVRWWDEDRARKAVFVSLLVWVLLLGLTIVLIYLEHTLNGGG
jgi:uncharacterized hydrophobic protein (TIGR00341 family)